MIPIAQAIEFTGASLTRFALTSCTLYRGLLLCHNVIREATQTSLSQRAISPTEIELIMYYLNINLSKVIPGIWVVRQGEQLNSQIEGNTKGNINCGITPNTYTKYIFILCLEFQAQPIIPLESPRW